MILCLREIKCNSRAYGAMGQSQTPKMERFAKILKGLMHVTTSAKKVPSPIFDRLLNIHKFLIKIASVNSIILQFY